MTESEKEQLLRQLVQLSYKDLVDVLTEALEKRRGDIGPDRASRICLAELYGAADEGAPQEWDLALLGRANAGINAFSEDTPVTQFGACCGFSILGYAKSITCPVCGKSVDAT